MNGLLVAVGASLGGYDAARVLLGALPAGYGAPLVLVLHRHPSTDDALLVGLGRATPLAVVEPDDKRPLEPGFVFVAPAGYHLLVDGPSLALSTEGPVHASRPSIDVLFDTAARAFGPSVVAVVLTGASADGAEGAAEVRRRGGTVLVQDPAEAEAAVLPSAALPCASAVLPLAGIAARLAALAPRREAVP